MKSPLFMRHQGEFYKQIHGVPMGAACSPDIANLYGAHFEKSFLPEGGHPHIPFFGQYIDDCLAVVYADSTDEALALCEGLIKYDGINVTWSVLE